MTLRGIRGRIVVTVIGLVALTSAVLGVAAYAYVATSLRDQQLASARELTTFNATVLAPDLLPAGANATSPATASLAASFASRGIAGTIVDFGDGNPFVSGLSAQGAIGQLSPELRRVVGAGDVGYQRLTIDGTPYLLTGARTARGPELFFLFDSTAVEDAIGQLGQALLIGGVLLVVLAALAGGFVARGLLLPVRNAARAAERIADGDLSARLASEPHDEFGLWAASFNRMAASVEDHVGELQAARSREQRFAADVSHELRTPLTALVSEAALLRDHLDALPPATRRVGELLVLDVARLRTLVDDLMEVSRFDAGAEQPSTGTFELGAFVHSVVAARLPDARVVLPDGGARIATDARRVERVLGNLLDNARVHGESRSVEVEARLERAAAAPLAGDATRDLGPSLPERLATDSALPGGTDSLPGEPATLVLAVSDRGPGVAPDQLDHLFDRFAKADPSRHLGGSGLGLAIAREHALVLGGTLATTLRPGGGMRFELRIPVTRLLPDRDTPVTDALETPIPLEPPTESVR